MRLDGIVSLQPKSLMGRHLLSHVDRYNLFLAFEVICRHDRERIDRIVTGVFN